MSIILKAENISKQYRLGTVGTGTISHDLNRWWHLVRGKEDPYLKIGGINDRRAKATEDYVWALQDINFEVKQGEVLGIIGKNGAGKSTLLKILSRVTGPTTGSIKTKGRIASLLEVGTGFHGELTGRENIYLNGAILGMTKPEINSKLEEIIDFSGCEMYIDTPVKRYSSGMTVRLGFAVAAHLEPEILVVDEVLAVGDAEFQKKAIGKMQDLSTGEGRTVLFVSHNMASVKGLCTRGIVLENGFNVYEDTADKAVSYYLKEGKNESNQELRLRTDRIGNTSIFKFEEITIEDSLGNNVSSLISGQSYKFRIKFSRAETIDLRKVMVTIGIKDNQDNLICFWSFDEMGFTFNENSCSIILNITKFMLRGGNYRIWLFSSYSNTAPENFCDVIDYVKSINVTPSDYFGSGKQNRSNAIVLMDGEFE
ncbi:ABC transporter ATP-binding protein [Salegentibacter sp. BDJ18]|uniref:ABC transporter ATP-binding protein n=1 Tax=Salegentibacter sp. BDJ18 TaxID=2816376 RepID=UPI001AAE6C66|nr:ABC transporter ATP-binding protein [Salegentibacter sp. BDJ18]MBO2544282.1 ABC transporter ATP-binding protein [Salegentibacter sp. BDJ18]